MKVMDKKTLGETVQVQGGDLKAQITLEAPSTVSLKEYAKKALEFLNWLKDPAQTKLDFSSSTKLYNCTIRTDKPTAKMLNGSIALIIPMKSAADRQAMNALFVMADAAKLVDVKISAIPKKPEKKKSTEPAKRAEIK